MTVSALGGEAFCGAGGPEMARINRHPEVGRYLNRPVDQQAIAAFYSQMTDHWETHGYGPWALE